MLASVQKILEVSDIPNADKIDRVKVLGWDCIVRKGQFKVGDLCIFIEPDTIVPKYLLTDNPEDTEEIRLKTIKMKKQVSYGLVLPLNKDYPFIDNNACLVVSEGADLTELMKVRKYEKFIPANMQGIMKGGFPAFLRKTDEVNIQSSPELLDLMVGKPYYITQKLDGTSGTFFKWNGEFGVCSRNIWIKEPTEPDWFKTGGGNVYWRMAEKYKISQWLPEGYAIQGEICGPNIQDNRLGLKELEMFVFNIFDIQNQKYMSIEDFENRFPELDSDLEFDYCVKFVPFVEWSSQGRGNFYYTIEQLLALAEKDAYPNGTPQEGIVVRSWDQTISFKVRNPKYLLMFGE